MVHAGRQDIALLRRRFETPVRNVFDTQVAAGFAGMAAQTSYETLLSELLGVRLAKSASFTRWDARPLSREQLTYAREDVVHLIELAGELQRRLRASGRLEWALEECRALEQSSDDATRRRSSRGCPASATSVQPRKRSHASWSPGASAPRPRRTAPCRACSPTRCWSRSPSAAPPHTRARTDPWPRPGRPASPWPRAAGGSPRRRRARRRASTPARAPTAQRPPRPRRRPARRALRSARPCPRAGIRTRLRADRRPRRPAGARRRGPFRLA